MIKVFNLLTDETLHFDDDVKYGPEWAVAYAWCEEHNYMSLLFSHFHDGTFAEFFKTLPVTRGKQSIACGDFACYLGETV